MGSRVATSINPQAKLYTVGRRSEFSDAYMESVDEDSKSNCKIEFMVMPGFRIADRLVKSRVDVPKPE
ncbi:hypothetical protein LINGRAHAP2_LOCUS22714 [Linum grandiflorum]